MNKAERWDYIHETFLNIIQEEEIFPAFKKIELLEELFNISGAVLMEDMNYYKIPRKSWKDIKEVLQTHEPKFTRVL